MHLSDNEIAKLCYGCIIKADVYKSSGKDAAGPHYAVILDSDEDVKNFDSYYTVVISHNNLIDPEFCIPVPGQTGLTGFVVCSWNQEIHLAGIREVGAVISPPNMEIILKKIHEANKAKAAKKGRAVKNRSTQN